MTLTEHLLTHRVIALDSFIQNETAMKLYYDMTDHAVFNSSMVSDKRGDLHAEVDTDYQDVMNHGRISQTAFGYSFTETSRVLLDQISEDVAGILGTKMSQFEPWQCTRYFTGGLFDYHDDCGNWASNERLYTVMLTVRAPDFGGATHFPRLNKTIPSKSARLVIWRNLDENNLCSGQTQHAGMPVGELGKEDEKMILVTWIRRFDYVS